MTIRLLLGMESGSTTHSPGAILNLNPALEADLVSTNRATWVTPPALTGDAGKPVQAVMSPGGGIASRRRGTIVSSASGRPTGLPRDRMTELLSWMRPTHLPILQPQEHFGMTPIVSGALTISHDSTVGDFSGSSIKLAFSGDAAPGGIRLPLPASPEQGVSAIKRKVGGAVHIRMRCSDWSKLTRLYIGLAADGGSTNVYTAVIMNVSRTRFGCNDPAYADRWNDQWRTLVVQSRDFLKAGAPQPWGLDAKYITNIDGVIFTVITTAAVDIWIDRIYSPDWPCGVVTPVFDGWYSTARALVKREWVPRGWGCGGSANRVEAGGTYPSFADLAEMSDLGFDVFAHGHILNGINPAPTEDTTTEEQYAPILAAQRRALFAAGVDPRGMRWHQWLQAGGKGVMDIVKVLKNQGINAGRGEPNDSEFGCNPQNTTYISETTLVGPTTFVSARGRFSRQYSGGHLSGANVDYFAARTDPDVLTIREALEYTAMTTQALSMFDHEIMDTPTQFDVASVQMQNRIAHMEELERAGKIMILNPTDLEELTYWRPGEVFVRWDGEWVYRHDPTKIAF